jgi:hypothetical protein
MADAELSDKQAIETILGRPLNQNWPDHAIPAGTRVTVIQDADWRGPWSQEFQGTIDSMGAPEPIPNAKANPGELRYWVQFDEPQRDADGAGPYRKASIWARYLRPHDQTVSDDL